MQTVAKKLLKLLLFGAITYGTGLVGAYFTRSSLDVWYAALMKPAFTPPGWIFSVVWTLCYGMMAVAVFRISERRPLRAGGGMIIALFFLHLIVNLLWSAVFFGLRDPESAFTVLAALTIFVAVLTYRFVRIDRIAGWLMAPYLIWIGYALYLNLGIILLN